MQIQSSIQAYQSQGLMQQQNTDKDSKLSKEDKLSLEAILSTINPKEMTQDDYASLRDSLKEADIPRSKETKDFLENAGVDIKELMQGSQNGLEELFGDIKNLFSDLLQQLQTPDNEDSNIKELLSDMSVQEMIKPNQENAKLDNGSFLGNLLQQVSSGEISPKEMISQVEQHSQRTTGAFLNISV